MMEENNSVSETESKSKKANLHESGAKMNKTAAATILQRSWRRHIDVQVFKYYRDLINFKNRGDPMMMLKCINPKEAKLLDAAAGIHIKFRLAGEKFPPNIYYKIYTHRPVQDLCANSPKDYTAAPCKQKPALDVHNNVDRLPKETKSGWYKRFENNGWRLVSDRLLKHMSADPVTWSTSNKTYDFHHNKLTRQQDFERRKKQKKIQWMKKMYEHGMMKAKVEDEETIQLIEGAAAGMAVAVDQQGPDAVHDWEVEELLEWTTSLNFDQYLSSWKETATSAPSEKQINDRLQMTISQWKPYDIQIRSKTASDSQFSNTPEGSNFTNEVNLVT